MSKFDSRKGGKQGPHDDCDGCEAMKAIKSNLQTTKETPPQQTSSSSSSSVLPAPPDIGELGRGTWTLLHTMAAYYPEAPSAQQQRDTRDFLASLGKVFPCRWCADDFVDSMSHKPPQLHSRTAFAQWLCEAHNEVNTKLGKPIFDCALVDRRWRNERRRDQH
jgi:mitochondrial FAD-linked sulfhydryl oxidase